MSNIPIPYTFIAGKIIDPDQMNANFQAVSTGAVSEVGGDLNSPILTNPTLTGTITLTPGTAFSGHLLFTPDATWDIGQSGANRPRDLFLSRKLTMDGVLSVNGFGSHAFIATGTGENSVAVRNLSPGSTNSASLFIGNDGSLSAGTITHTASNYTSGTFDLADAFLIHGNRIGGCSLAARHGSGAIRFYTGGTTERMQIGADGNVGIGVAPFNPYRLSVRGADDTTGYSLVLENSSGLTTLYVQNNNVAYISASAWTYGSDRNLKEHIDYFADGLATIRQLQPVRFDYRGEGPKRQLGFVAQDVQPIIPEAVTVTDVKTGQLGLKTSFILPFVVNAINELDARLAHLEGRL